MATGRSRALGPDARPAAATLAGGDVGIVALEQRHADLDGAQQGREDWQTAHADTLAYRHQLAESIAQRRRALGV